MSAFDTQLAHLQHADTRHAVEIGPRIWWVGHLLEDDIFQCHVYLIEQGDQSVLIDPGSLLTFAHTREKIEEVIPFTAIRYFICQHQDPDIAASLPTLDALIDRPDAVVVTHWRTQTLLKHYGIRTPFWLVDKNDWRLQLEDRELAFIFTPYAHFPGAICTFDKSTGVLFSSDLFGGFTEQPRLLAEDESYFESMRPFHEHYIPSPDILDFALTKIAEHEVKVIAPQHGSIIPEHLVPFMVEQLSHLDCGIYLHAKENTDIQRLSRLNTTLREITQTMLLYRDFRDIAARLLHVVSRGLPVERIDYYTRLEDGTVLTLSPENQFSGVRDPIPEGIARLIGIDHKEWLRLHHEHPQLKAHSIRLGSFCTHPSPDGTLVLTLPLISPQTHVVEAVALLQLTQIDELTREDEQVIQQITMPLQVALEREVIYRSIDSKREEAYQRSIHDSLTGLCNRLYMQDVMKRQCRIHDRDPHAGFAAIMLDIDHFKSINDRHGHAAGDQALKQIAELMRMASRETDVLVRLGGEEFVLFSLGANQKGAIMHAERLRSLIEQRGCSLESGVSLKLTVSLGVALRAQLEPLDAVIQRADQALYRAKQDGRNCCRVAQPAPAQPPAAAGECFPAG
ncbi:diguanylate cyclase [Thiorhodococcus mannitoliphagus]|uniref:diguanylate cyclase n=1 Tax=Thiorhodococcus mannitoliphagus TaxID=329406 RepID=A0A6P1DP56_9GAMM|nr:diguanylate cyclase [Thiorhodococcus mannitoliphagus]NEX19709.1 diguanylate cyclase [Thiorhodococcus mannitoliphagus]